MLCETMDTLEAAVALVDMLEHELLSSRGTVAASSSLFWTARLP